jgi:tRNA A37 threonylcarbamoyladenosine dehydratase
LKKIKLELEVEENLSFTMICSILSSIVSHNTFKYFIQELENKIPIICYFDQIKPISFNFKCQQKQLKNLEEMKFETKNLIVSKELKNTRILLIGAGGNGTEIIKNLISFGFKCITITDMDTVDITNLNRQFYFTEDDVGKFKSMAMKDSIDKLFKIKIEAFSKKIQQFKIEELSQFDILICAVDNHGKCLYLTFRCKKIY